MQGLARSLRIEQIPSLAASIDQAACLMKALDVKIAPGPPWQGNHQSFKISGAAVVFQGQGKRVPVSGFRQQRRAGRGKRGIALNCGDTLAAVHMVSSCAAYACIACGKQVGLEERYCWQEE